MKNILIITPHFPPSNLAAVHRSRLFAQHLPSFGWNPVILTVDEKYYEEALDWNLHKLLPANLRIEKVSAFGVGRPRLVGDIGLRGFFQLYRRARKLIKTERIDFLYIPIPSFYCALLGRWLHEKTGVRYGIDYIDPWVHQFPGSDKKFSRHWWSTKLAQWLEPIAVKKASLITGVAEGYYKGVQERNPHLLGGCLFGAMPYGGETSDHHAVKDLRLSPYLFESKKHKLQMVYAGAMLPNAYEPLERIFQSIASHTDLFSEVEVHFIGTGKSPDDEQGYNIKALAEQYGLWRTHVFEYPARIPYLDVLVHLDASDAVFILGSTDPHYTPSKVYQGVLSDKPVFAVLHQDSTAIEVLRNSGAGKVIGFNGKEGIDTITAEFPGIWQEFVSFSEAFNSSSVEKSVFDQYSAKAVTRKLADCLNKMVN